MIVRNCDGVPAPAPFAPPDEAILARAHGLLDGVRPLYDAQAFHKALEIQWDLCGAANKYVDDMAPWALRKTDPARMNTVLYTLAEVIRHLAILIQPVMPRAAADILDQLNIPLNDRGFDRLGPDHALAPGSLLEPPEPVFPRHAAEADRSR